MDGDVDLARKTNGWDLAVAMDIDGLLYALFDETIAMGGYDPHG